MISLVRGKLIQSTPSFVLIETGGIGYKILIPPNVYAKLPPQNSELVLHTSFVVREISHTLYGFLQQEERELFELLQNVSGIGPKTALSIIGHLTIHELHQAVHQNNLPLICKVPGIGKKTAERLVIEIRGKLPALFPHSFSDIATYIPQDPQAQMIADAMSALINLGYNQVSAQKAIKKTMKDNGEGLDLSLLITQSLKNI